jgi:type VI secretion system protein ImpM
VDVGLYGKLPSHGDFLRRRTSDAFVDVWDAWLQQCMAASRSTLGESWLDLYLTSPVWRFACAAHVCGPAPLLGVVAPSVDRVGRYFPLTVVCEMPDDTNVIAAATDATAFFETSEQLIVEALAEVETDFDGFDGRLVRLGEALAFASAPGPVILDRTAAALLADKGGIGWQMPLGSVGQLAPVLSQLLSHRLSELYEPVSLWWTDGSSAVSPSCLITKGLPHPDTFKAFLDGTWSAERWQTVAASVEIPERDGDTLPLTAPLITCRSIGATDVGRVRSVNQDAFLDRSEIGLWVVADGLGGHTDGDVASRMVCDALADFHPTPTFEEMVEAVRDRIRGVNDHLLRTSQRSLRGAKMGSTVVVLLIRDRQSAVLWAGDSRIYRLRANRLQQLTSDHSAAVSIGRAGSNVVTRAVGVTAGLLLDVRDDDVRPGDRFLLCSDGLTRTIAEDGLEQWMQHADIEVTVEGLINASLAAGAPDNVTAVVVEAIGRDLTI